MPAPPPQALPPSHGRSSCVSQTQYVRIRWRLPGPWFSLATPNQTPPRSGKQPRRGSVLGTRTNSTRAPLDAQLAEQTRNRDHNSTDECGQARKQQKVTQSMSMRASPYLPMLCHTAQSKCQRPACVSASGTQNAKPPAKGGLFKIAHVRRFVGEQNCSPRREPDFMAPH